MQPLPTQAAAGGAVRQDSRRISGLRNIQNYSCSLFRTCVRRRRWFPRVWSTWNRRAVSLEQNSRTSFFNTPITDGLPISTSQCLLVCPLVGFRNAGCIITQAVRRTAAVQTYTFGSCASQSMPSVRKARESEWVHLGKKSLSASFTFCSILCKRG